MGTLEVPQQYEHLPAVDGIRGVFLLIHQRDNDEASLEQLPDNLEGVEWGLPAESVKVLDYEPRTRLDFSFPDQPQ